MSERWVAVPSSHPLAPRRLIESQLFGVGVIDPASYGSTVLLFGVVAVLACLTPARAATRVDPVEAFDKAQALDSRLVVSPQAWNSLCWAGALGGHPAEAMEACDKAVTLSGRPSFRRTGRGIARALTGDTEGAIEDFEVWAIPGERWRPTARQRAQELEWVAALRRGENPFTPAWLRTRRERSADSR